MGMNTYWATPTTPRHQLVLFSPSLDDAIKADDPLRQLDAIFQDLDWSEYERSYDGRHAWTTANSPAVRRGGHFLRNT